MPNKKIKLSSESVYIISLVIMAFSVAMTAASGFGVSMIVAPAYVLNLKIGVLTFGQCEYVVQAVLFILFCIIIRSFKPIYLSSFITCLIYGAVLDLWRLIIPGFNPDITTPGSMHMALRITYMLSGMVLTAFAVALILRSYIYPQVYDFFVKGIVQKFNLNFAKFKTIYDFSFLAIGIIFSLLFFRKIEGMGLGTIITTICNGTIIGFFNKLIDKYFIIEPRFKKLSHYFEIK